MYKYSYEEYMNNLLGYNTKTRNNAYMTQNPEPYEDENVFTYTNNTSNNELEECYPDIYKIVYPMICKACLYITEELTPELVERITNEIYENLEQEETPQETRMAQVNINYSNMRNNRNLLNAYRNSVEQVVQEEKRQRNFLINDLIKILVLRELIGQGSRMPRQFEPMRSIMPINNEGLKEKSIRF